MSSDEYRKGINQALINQQSAGWLVLEIVLFSLYILIKLNSWLIAGIVFVALFIGIYLKYISVIIALCLPFFCAYVGWVFGALFNDFWAQIVISIIVLFFFLGMNYNALEFIKDITH